MGSENPIGLADAIASLRAELSRARQDSEGKDVRFAVEKIEVEMSIEFGWTQDVSGAIKLLSFVQFGGKDAESSKTGHKVKLLLTIDSSGATSEPFRISGPGPAPVLGD
jgi:hypothetical protein